MERGLDRRVRPLFLELPGAIVAQEHLFRSAFSTSLEQCVREALRLRPSRWERAKSWKSAAEGRLRPPFHRDGSVRHTPSAFERSPAESTGLFPSGPCAKEK